MKRALMGTALLLLAVQVYGEEPVKGAPPRADQKDWCLLDSSRCTGDGYPLLEKIDRLRRAIAQGNTVYTPEELKTLQAKLREAEEYNDLLTT